VVYLVSFILFFTAKYIHPALDFPKAVANKQHDFLLLKGGSAVPVTHLQPTVISFMKNTPEALAIAALRPFPSDVKHLLSLAASVEINLLLLCFIVFVFFRKNGHHANSFLLFCLFFTFSSLLTIGYTVNFLGAVVRYRSLVLPFLVTPMIAFTDWEKVNFLIFKKH
jgi:hypothetical protein